MQEFNNDNTISINLCFNNFIYLFIYINLVINQSVYLYMYIYLFISLSISINLCNSLFLFFFLSLSHSHSLSPLPHHLFPLLAASPHPLVLTHPHHPSPSSLHPALPVPVAAELVNTIAVEMRTTTPDDVATAGTYTG